MSKPERMSGDDDVGRNPERCEDTFETIENGMEGAVFTRSQVERLTSKHTEEIRRLRASMEAMERDRAGTVEERDAALAELARLAPSKQVWDDVAIARVAMRHTEECGAADGVGCTCPVGPGRNALSRLQNMAAEATPLRAENSELRAALTWVAEADSNAAWNNAKRLAEQKPVAEEELRKYVAMGVIVEALAAALLKAVSYEIDGRLCWCMSPCRTGDRNQACASAEAALRLAGRLP